MKYLVCAVSAALGTVLLTRDDRWSRLSFFQLFSYLFLAQLVVYFLYTIFIYPFHRSPLRHLPGPKNGKFFFGQTLRFFQAEGPNELPLEFMKSNPSAPLIRYLHVFNSEWVLVSSVEACREVLQTKCYDFAKPEFFRRIVGEIAGIGLVNIDGDEHKRQRRLLHGPMNTISVRKLVGMFNSKAEDLARTIAVRVEQSSATSIDVHDALSKTTLDIIGEACLGVQLHSLSSQNTPFSTLYNRILHQPPAGQLISVINTFIPCRKWLPFKANQDFLHATSEVRRLLLGIIKERTKAIAKAEQTGSTIPKDADFLTLMLLDRNSGLNNWSDNDILGHLLNFMTAGHDTPSLTLTWALHTLCLQPTIQARLRKEITDRIPSSQSPTATDLESLHYMDTFIKEVLRCLSPTILIPRTPARAGVTICNTEIPVGTTLLINQQAIHSNPTIWGPDVQLFNPDRHSPNHPSAKQYPKSRDPYALESFSNGPRFCIGKSFALLEIKSVLVELLRRFQMERGWDEEGDRLRDGEEFVGTGKEEDIFAGVKVQNFITLRPRDGAWVRFKALEGTSC